MKGSDKAESFVVAEINPSERLVTFKATQVRCKSSARVDGFGGTGSAAFADVFLTPRAIGLVLLSCVVSSSIACLVSCILSFLTQAREAGEGMIPVGGLRWSVLDGDDDDDDDINSGGYDDDADGREIRTL